MKKGGGLICQIAGLLSRIISRGDKIGQEYTPH